MSDEKKQEIEPGMAVEATEGDLGESDLTKPKVVDVVHGKAGELEKVVVKKGAIFSKEIEIPADRVQEVLSPSETDKPKGKVVIAAKEPEIEALSAVGSQTLPDESSDVLDTIEEAVPTDDGLRQMELRNQLASQKSEKHINYFAADSAQNTPATNQKKKVSLLKTLGPGFLGGMSGNDPTAVTGYAVDGASNGYGHLWLMLISTPLWQAVLFACAKIGRITQKGFSEILREHYSRKVAIFAALLLIAGNVVLIAGDLVAIGSGLELITGFGWIWFVIPVGVGLWYVTVYQNFDAIKKIFLIMSLAFVTYLITGFLSGANWGDVLKNTVVPKIDFSFASLSSAVAILGATMSPYTMFWQVQGEKEEQREGSTRQQLRIAAWDIGSGVVSGNIVSYFIMVCTSATLFAHQQQIKTAADAARSLEPLVGPFAKYLFAVGLIGAGMIAIPVLLASTSYALSGTFGLPASLSKKPWQSEGFYLIITVALVASLVVAMLGFDPIQLMFWANIIQATLAPILIVLIVLIGNNRKIMGDHRLGLVINICLILTALIMIIAAGLLFFGIFTGQNN